MGYKWGALVALIVRAGFGILFAKEMHTIFAMCWFSFWLVALVFRAFCGCCHIGQSVRVLIGSPRGSRHRLNLYCSRLRGFMRMSILKCRKAIYKSRLLWHSFLLLCCLICSVQFPLRMTKLLNNCELRELNLNMYGSFNSSPVFSIMPGWHHSSKVLGYADWYLHVFLLLFHSVFGSANLMKASFIRCLGHLQDIVCTEGWHYWHGEDDHLVSRVRTIILYEPLLISV